MRVLVVRDKGVPYEVELLEKMSVFITPDAVILLLD
jgi:hypothetical protein